MADDYGLMGVKDCPVTGAKLPLEVFSHGRGGWFAGHHDRAAFHRDFNASVIRFFREHLVGDGGAR
jgi:hypothetical protein